LVGLYAQRHFLKKLAKSSLTDTVMHWQDYAPRFIPLPHPSPRNTPWLKRNAWYERDLLPMLRARISAIIAA
jgi:uracil-DNA glycosylase